MTHPTGDKAPYPTTSFEVEAAGERWTGEVAGAFRPTDLAAAVERAIDPGNATETIHWGRNYLYRLSLAVVSNDGEQRPVDGDHGETVERDMVVKQFRNLGWRKLLERKLRGSKAWRSWKMARCFVERGIPTAEPVLWIESARSDGPSFFVCRHLPERMEARYLFRARKANRVEEDFPGFDYPAFLAAVAGALRRMHEAGFFHRDLSIGNVLLPQAAVEPDAAPLVADDLAIIDLNRARDTGDPGLWRRSRDLCRLEVFRREDRRHFLRSYWRGRPGWLRRAAYYACHWGFHAKIRTKKVVRAPFHNLAGHLKPRRAHVHIPDAPPDADARDKIVWDHLSDQPHQHASRLDKLRVRLADAPAHLRSQGAMLAAVPRILRRYRELRRELWTRPVPWGGAGVCLRPWDDADAQMELLAELGLCHLLLRLHPWQEEHDAEEELARRLVDAGYELTFALPQDRELVRRPELWRRRIEELAERFVPLGRHFQVGQAINRSKWGVWVYGEYCDLASAAAEILRRRGERQGVDVEILGPAVIDFEPYATAAVLNLRECPRFDAVASLLYVDRRGAPENAQLGFDTVGKALLVKAIAETSRAAAGRSWITEVNWPLREGPHAPAGKMVAVGEEEQADYLVRYYLLALATGACERVYWWQLVARGYGLISPEASSETPSSLRRRPSFHALATLERQLRGRTFLRRLPSEDGVFLLLFGQPEAVAGGQSASDGAAGGEMVVGWHAGAREHERTARLPWPPRKIVERDGGEGHLPAPDERSEPAIRLSGSARYFYE